MRGFTAISAVAVMLASLTVRAEDWPKWMGPRGDGISKETGLAQQWPQDGPKKLWTVEVGTGYASPVVVDGKLYMFTLVDGKDVLRCLDPETGKEIWKQSYDGGYDVAGKYPGTRCTPTIADGRIYTYGGHGQLYCRQLSDGKELWNVNVLKEAGTQCITWGQASSPLLYNNRIYVQGGASGPIVSAVDKETGKIVIKSENGLGGYAMLVVIDVAGGKQLIAFAGNAVYGMDPETLKTLWKHPWQTRYDVNAMTPLYHDGHLFLSSDYGHGGIMLKVGSAGVEKVWENKEMKAHYQPMILDGGVFYGNSEGTVKCMAWPSGEVKWIAKDRSLEMQSGGSMVRFGDKLILLGARGTLSLASATPAEFKLISQVQLFKATPIWATPLIYKGKLYAKGTQELVCLDISGK